MTCPLMIVETLFAPPIPSGAHPTGPEPITLDIAFHIITGLAMSVKERSLGMWVTCEDIANAIIPEINRIWRGAGISFAVKSCANEPSLNPRNKRELITVIEEARRGEDSDRQSSISKLINQNLRDNTALNVYLLPFIGSAYQGYATIGGNTAVVSVWSDKESGGREPPMQVLLVEPRPMRKGSLARTIAHELGHNLSLRHPPKNIPNPTPRLMGGSIQGYELTSEEVTSARDQALRHKTGIPAE